MLPISEFNNICFVGAGPSLDYCGPYLQKLSGESTLFILMDIVAYSFIKRYPHSKRLVFTVEQRKHGYLKQLRNENIAAYIHVPLQNIPIDDKDANRVYLFDFDFDQKAGSDLSRADQGIPGAVSVQQGLSARECTGRETFKHDISEVRTIISPGTVAGAALSFVLFDLQTSKHNHQIHLCGLDFCFPDQVMYNRYARHYVGISRFFNRETDELIRVFKKTSGVFMFQNHVIRTSHEFEKTRTNIQKLIGTCRKGIDFINYSPFGIHGDRIEKPQMI